MFYFYVFISPILFASGNMFFRFWANESKWWLLVSGLLLFVIGNYFVAHAIKLSSIFETISIVPIATLTLSLLIGYFYFHEKLATPQYFGLFFAVIAIILLTFPFTTLSK